MKKAKAGKKKKTEKPGVGVSPGEEFQFKGFWWKVEYVEPAYITAYITAYPTRKVKK